MLNDIQICHQGENKMTTEMVSIVLIWKENYDVYRKNWN
jgi:hypothetical protein